MAVDYFKVLTKKEAFDTAYRYVKCVQTFIPVDSAYLFGSYAKGTAHEDSDIDVAIVSPFFTGDPIDDRVWLMNKRHLIDSRIEPHPFTIERATRPAPFFLEVQRTGIPLL
ncbi:hypothetical protein AGMMS49992_07660 [Clostridia bacterium]|nr:hypothetical protein AGMMS49992_07660 [Clostridia bacterium]